jgi:hypothetical protein
MLRVVHLVNEICYVVFAIDIASFAVLMSGFFDFVLDHRLVGLEMFVAVVIATLDLACHLDPTLTFVICEGRAFYVNPW